MAAMPIYGKNTLIFSGTSVPISTKLGMNHRRLTQAHYIFCSNDKPCLNLTYFTARSNFATYVLSWENVMDSMKNIAFCALDFFLYSKLND